MAQIFAHLSLRYLVLVHPFGCNENHESYLERYSQFLLLVNWMTPTNPTPIQPINPTSTTFSIMYHQKNQKPPLTNHSKNPELQYPFIQKIGFLAILYDLFGMVEFRNQRLLVTSDDREPKGYYEPPAWRIISVRK